MITFKNTFKIEPKQLKVIILNLKKYNCEEIYLDKYKKESVLIVKNYRCFTNLIRKSVRIRYSPHYCEADESTQNH